MSSTNTTTKGKSKSKSSASSSNVPLKIGTKSKSAPWYIPTLTFVPPALSSILENYSQVRSEDIVLHVLSIREKAWSLHPTPFIGLFSFTVPSLSLTPSYTRILSSLQSGSKILDVGCGLGQDLRKIFYDGAPASSLYGLDIKSDLVELGYELFNVKPTWGGKMVIGDSFDIDKKGSKLFKQQGKFNFINIGQFLHLFDYNGQVQVLVNIVRLLRNEKGVMVTGHHVGNLEGKEVVSRSGKRSFRHDVQSFEGLWREVGRVVGGEWAVWGCWRGRRGGKEKEGWDEWGTWGVRFEVVRV